MNLEDARVALNQGWQRDGVLYLLSLCLLPVIPFVVASLLSSLTRMHSR